jgi:AcrR family transcriptional regulator
VTDRSAERALILDEAYRLLDSNGGAALQVTEILANTGLSTRAFYRHFKTRDDLLLVMFRRDRDRVLDELRTVAAEAATPVDALQQWVAKMFSLLAEPRRKRRLRTFDSEEMQRTRGYQEEVRRFGAAEQAILAQIIGEGRFKGYFPGADPAPDARSVLAVIEAGFVAQSRRHTADSAQETADQVLSFVLRALGAVAPSTNRVTDERLPGATRA